MIYSYLIVQNIEPILFKHTSKPNMSMYDEIIIENYHDSA